MFQKISSFWNHLFGQTESTEEGFFCKPLSNKHTPSYILIAKDLENKSEQIFEAAVYDLCLIAAQKTSYQAAILNLLKSYIAKYPKAANRHQHIQKMLSEFQLFTD